MSSGGSCTCSSVGGCTYTCNPGWFNDDGIVTNGCENQAPKWFTPSENNTNPKSGEAVEFSVNWTDVIGTAGMGLGINYTWFSWNASGTNCDTWVNISFTARNNVNSAWHNETQTIPAACSGKKIAWKQYANDSAGEINVSQERIITVQGIQAPQYSLNSTSSTTAGSLVSHNLFWQDDSGLSHAIFSFDNCTGSLQNISSMSLSGSQAWSNFTVTINSTIGCTIRWCVYANDTSNNWNRTSCDNPFSYITKPPELIKALTYTMSLVNWDESIETVYLGYIIGKKTLSDLENKYNQLTSWSDILLWSAILKKFGIENETLIKQALNDAPMMDNGLPKTGTFGGKDGMWIEFGSRAAWGYYFAEKYNYLTSKWNKTKAYESAKSTLDNNGKPASAICYDNTAYTFAQRLLEADATIFMFLEFYDVGITSALDDAEKWWDWTNNNHWISDHYTYRADWQDYVWDAPDLIQAALKLQHYKSSVGNTTRLLTDIYKRYLENTWASKQWTIGTTKYYATVHHNPSNSQRRMWGMPIAWAAILGHYEFYDEANKSIVQDMMTGFDGYYPAWKLLFNSSHNLYDSKTGKFRMDSDVEVSNLATAWASALLFTLGIVPQTASLAIPIEYFYCGYEKNIYDGGIYNINTTSRTVTLGIIKSGTVKFLFNSSVTETFSNDGLYQLTFAPDWNSIIQIERLGDLPQRLYIVETTPPTFSLNSTNSTTAGTAVEHRLKWTDNAGLSGYIFSFCNGTWNGSHCLGMSENWWNSSWQYRKSHVIQNATGAGTNYQVKIIVKNETGTDSGDTVYVYNKARSDFGDIRFTNSTGSLLDYWMESINNGINATFWVEIANNLNSTNATIYIYYGNSAAVNMSNGTNTFLFFDDFLGSSLDTSKWTEYGSGTVSVSNSEVTITPSTGSSKYIGTANIFGTGTRFRGKSRMLATGIASSEFGLSFIPRTIPLLIVNKYTQANFQYYAYGTQADSGLVKDSNNHIIEVGRINSTTTRHSIDNSYAQLISGTANSSSLGILIFEYYSYSIVSDWVFVSKYVYPEPAHGAWGIEETQGYQDGWVNYSWAQFPGIPTDSSWSNVTKTVNSTVGATIAWCVYANDTSNNWNSSCQNPFSYYTTTPPFQTTTFPFYPNQRAICRDSSNYIHVVWLYNSTNIRYARSNDNGLTWQVNTSFYGSISTPTSTKASPTISCDGNNITIAYIDSTAAIVAISTNNGGTWSFSNPITSCLTSSTFVSVQRKGERIYLVYQNSSTSGCGYGDIGFINSTDGGATWGEKKLLFDGWYVIGVGYGYYYEPSIFVNGTGTSSDFLHVVTWLLEFEGLDYYYLLYINSSDAGANWGTAKILSTRYVRYPSISGNSSGGVFIAYSDVDSIILINISSDNGATWQGYQLDVDNNKTAYPSVTLNNLGLPIVFWQQNNTATNQLYNIVYRNYTGTWSDITWLTNDNNKNQFPNTKIDYSGNCIEFVYVKGTASPYDIIYSHLGTCTAPSLPYLEVELSSPPLSYNVNQNSTFTLNATVYCRGGSCGNVYGTVRYNASSLYPDTPINTTQGDKPFFIQETPALAMKECPTNPLDQNEFCNLTWVVNATGNVNSVWKVGVLFNSSLAEVQQNHTQNSTIAILSEIESFSLAWSSIDFGFLVPNTPAENNPAPGNENNLYNITNTGTCSPNLWIKGADLQNLTFNSFIAVGNLSWSNSSSTYNPSTVYPIKYNYELLCSALPPNSNLTTYYWLSVPSVYAGIYKGTITICGNCSSLCD